MKNSYWLSLTILLSTIITTLLYWPIISNLNSSLLVYGGDANKNYFTYLFYIANDTGLKFTGMNYPFGEHIVFTDNSPIISYTVSKLSIVFPEIKHYSIGIFHFILIASFPVSSFFYYKIFEQFKTPVFWGVLGTLFITFTTPQFAKLSGHFALAVMFYLPALIYWLMRYHYTLKLKYVFYILFLTLVFSFMHLYNVAFSMFLLLFYLLAKFIIDFKKGFKQLLLSSVPLLIAAIIPTIIIKLFLHYTDTIKDRPQIPFGIFSNGSNFNELFVSKYVPLGSILSFIFGKSPEYPSEGYSYLGLIGSVFMFYLFALIIIFLVNKFSKRKYNSQFVQKEYLIWLLVAFFFLLLAFGFPIKFGLEFLIDYISSLRQVRSVGRFAFVFYILFQVYVFISLPVVLNYLKQKFSIKPQVVTIISIAIAMILIVQMTGIYSYQTFRLWEDSKSNYNKLIGNTDQGNFKDFLNDHHINTKDVQCLISFPIYHAGSEKIWLPEGDPYPSIIRSIEMSYQTNIPIVDVMMSRTSWSETFSMLQLFNGVFTPKPLLEKFNDKLIIAAFEKDRPNEDHRADEWKVAGKNLGEWNGFEIYVLTKNELLTYEANYKNEIIERIKNEKRDIGMVNHKPLDFLIYSNFEAIKDRKIKGYHSENALQKSDNRFTSLIFDVSKYPKVRDTQNYIVSFWVKVPEKDFRSPGYKIVGENKNGETVFEVSSDAKFSMLNDNFWFQCKTVIPITTNVDKLILKLNRGYFASHSSFFGIDDIWIYPEKAIVYQKRNGKIISIDNVIQ